MGGRRSGMAVGRPAPRPSPGPPPSGLRAARSQTVRGFDPPRRVDKAGDDLDRRLPMKFKSGFLVGLGAGYVLGAKAGEERYQQIVEAAKSLRENPGVQRLSGEVNRTVAVGKDRVGEAASRKAEQAADAAAAQAS